MQWKNGDQRGGAKQGMGVVEGGYTVAARPESNEVGGLLGGVQQSAVECSEGRLAIQK